jgi:hypothetical protein
MCYLSRTFFFFSICVRRTRQVDSARVLLFSPAVLVVRLRKTAHALPERFAIHSPSYLHERSTVPGFPSHNRALLHARIFICLRILVVPRAHALLRFAIPWYNLLQPRVSEQWDCVEDYFRRKDGCVSLALFCFVQFADHVFVLLLRYLNEKSMKWIEEYVPEAPACNHHSPRYLLIRSCSGLYRGSLIRKLIPRHPI